MRLTLQDIKNTTVWEDAGFSLPQFSMQNIAMNTRNQPTWIHFGPGNIFRAFLANIAQILLNQGLYDKGIIVAEGYDYEIIDKQSIPHDQLSLLVTLKGNGTTEKIIVASITESLKAGREFEEDFRRLEQIFANPSLQMASFTITEKGYNIKDSDGKDLPAIRKDYEAGPFQTESYLGKITSLCYHRYQSGALPVALVSMDNCAHNGTRLYNAITAFATQWQQQGLIDSGFLEYLNNPEQVGFPWTMIDKITPRPDPSIGTMLGSLGYEDTEPLMTAKNTYVASFVNAEETQYLVMEDWFPNGHPPLEQAGVLFTTKETVDQVEKMKVGTCLNPLHTALAIFGCLLGYSKISDEMKDTDLVALIKQIGYVEGLPVVIDPQVISPKEFMDTVINVRLPNPYLPDTPQRIATDTSQKLAPRFGETIKAYQRAGKPMDHLIGIPLVFAAWCRYLMGIDDQGNTMEISPDPLLRQLHPIFKSVALGDSKSCQSILRPVLSNASLFGIDLYQTSLGHQVETYFAQMCQDLGAVRSLLHQCMTNQ